MGSNKSTAIRMYQLDPNSTCENDTTLNKFCNRVMSTKCTNYEIKELADANRMYTALHDGKRVDLLSAALLGARYPYKAYYLHSQIPCKDTSVCNKSLSSGYKYGEITLTSDELPRITVVPRKGLQWHFGDLIGPDDPQWPETVQWNSFMQYRKLGKLIQFADPKALPPTTIGDEATHLDKTVFVVQNEKADQSDSGGGRLVHNFLVLTHHPNTFKKYLDKCSGVDIGPKVIVDLERRRLDMLTAGAPIAGDSNLQALPAPGSPFLQAGLLFAGGVLGGYLLKQCLRRFRKPEPRRDSFGFLPNSRRPSLTVPERMV